MVPLGYLVTLYLFFPLFFDTFKTCLLEEVTRADSSSPGLFKIELLKMDNRFLDIRWLLSNIGVDFGISD